jgi:hypothetical protein
VNITDDSWHSQGRQQRTKQGDPTPLKGASDHPASELRKGKRKAALEAKTTRDGGLPASSARQAKKARKSTDSNGTAPSPATKKGKGKAKVENKKSKLAKDVEWESDDEEDIGNMKAEEDWSDLESDEGGQDLGLEKARS